VRGVNDDRRRRLLALADRLGTPCFVYFLDEARARIAAVRQAFGGAFAITYAIKANPAPALLRGLRDAVDGMDVSSGGELARALAAGCPAAAIHFTGPGKRTAELAAAVAAGVGAVVLESREEAAVLADLARAAGVRQRVLVRIAPDRVPAGFGDTMSGKPVAFGIDEEDVPAFLADLRRWPELALAGFHAYSGTQCLKPDAIAANWAIFARVFAAAADAAGTAPEQLVLGAGLGLAYHDDQRPLDLAEVARHAAPVLADLRARFPLAQLALETGRYLVGDAGVYLLRVLRTKDSRGVRIGICDGGFHHHLAAAGMFGMVLKRNFRLANVSVADGPAAGTFQLSGPLCTSLDVLGRAVPLPRLQQGDVIAIAASGAYGPTASPTGFLSHPPAGEWLVDGDQIVDARA
jgi:diaminopimelate decarboxylase